MSETIFEPGPDDQSNDRAIDIDQAFGENGVDALAATSYSPPERPLGLDEYGTTLTEQHDGESLDQRIAREIPDPNLDVDLVDGEPSPRAGEDTQVPDDIDTGDPLAGEVPDWAVTDGVLDDGEVGDARAGRLVDTDGGFGVDTWDSEKDLVGMDVGIDDGAATAEEAAMHVIDLDEADAAIDRDRAQEPTI